MNSSADHCISAITAPGDVFKAPGADRYALLVQLGSAGRIVAARYL